MPQKSVGVRSQEMAPTSSVPALKTIPSSAGSPVKSSLPDSTTSPLSTRMISNGTSPIGAGAHGEHTFGNVVVMWCPAIVSSSSTGVRVELA